MLFNSLSFLVFFPIVVLIYFVVPDKVKNAWLLIASYFFYMCWNPKYILLILFSTIVTYASGLVMEKIKQSDFTDEKKKLLKNYTVATSFVLNIGLLSFFKYTNMFMGTVQTLMNMCNVSIIMPRVNVLLPVGISFYTFQALSYTMDVYRDEIYAERNFVRYALFVSFFPQLVAGPIERSKNLLKQLSVTYRFKYENFANGMMLMLWGFFLKLVIADRAAIYVDTVYNDIDTYGGWYLVVAGFLFSVQVYCDFYGYSIIAKGAAKVIGIDLMENFNAPFLQTTTSAMWRNWHMSLTAWFRDYLYFPLGGSRKGKIRKYINILIIFTVSGLWHGAAYTYIIWGFSAGFFQVIGEITEPYRKKINAYFGLDREKIGHKLAMIASTFVLFTVSVIIFRANSVTQSIMIYKSFFTVHNPWILFDGSIYSCGLNQKNFILLMISIAILLVADICKIKNIEVRKVILSQNILYKSIAIAASIVFVLIFGIWGPSVDAANFIYFQF